LAAALGMLVAAVAPLSSEPTVGLFARPALLAATVLTAALYAVAAFVAVRLSIALTFVGVLLGCSVTLALLRDSAIAGYAAWGFWLPVVAGWIAAWLGVARLATVKPRDKAAPTPQDHNPDLEPSLPLVMTKVGRASPDASGRKRKPGSVPPS